MSYSCTWHQLYCPECESSNFVDAGDITDVSGYEVDGCKCWNCGHCFNIEEYDERDLDESYYEDGTHFIDAKLLLDAIKLVDDKKHAKKIKELKKKAGFKT